ncbi:hypothetical protein Btru_015949 [Bulinus truncatus]|nr:hypothetical protein Btru_015949 [Bulinus truncatus]
MDFIVYIDLRYEACPINVFPRQLLAYITIATRECPEVDEDINYAIVRVPNDHLDLMTFVTDFFNSWTTQLNSTASLAVLFDESGEAIANFISNHITCMKSDPFLTKYPSKGDVETPVFAMNRVRACTLEIFSADCAEYLWLLPNMSVIFLEAEELEAGNLVYLLGAAATLVFSFPSMASFSFLWQAFKCRFSIMKLKESGIIDGWRRQWWTGSGNKCSDADRVSTVNQLDLKYLAGPFIVLLTAMALSILVITVEKSYLVIRSRMTEPQVKERIRGPSGGNDQSPQVVEMIRGPSGGNDHRPKWWKLSDAQKVEMIIGPSGGNDQSPKRWK